MARTIAMARGSADRSVPGAAVAMTVGVPAPARTVPARRRHGVADQRARARADDAAGNGAARASPGHRRPDQRATAGADRATGQRTCLLLRRVAARNGQCASKSKREGESFLHVSPLAGSIESGADRVAVIVVAPLGALARRRP